jgi:ADP-ribose pyrophosphatase YjhB (NUDIX family)
VAAGPAIGAIVACVDGDERLLVVKQTTGPFTGAWLMPGGTLERGEPVEGCARRELTEETGYEAAELWPVAVYDVRGARPDGFHIMLHMFRSGRVTGTARAEAGSEVRWAHPNEIELHPSMAVQLADLGLIRRDPEEMARGLARIGLDVRRLPQR